MNTVKAKISHQCILCISVDALQSWKHKRGVLHFWMRILASEASSLHGIIQKQGTTTFRLISQIKHCIIVCSHTVINMTVTVLNAGVFFFHCSCAECRCTDKQHSPSIDWWTTPTDTVTSTNKKQLSCIELLFVNSKLEEMMKNL